MLHSPFSVKWQAMLIHQWIPPMKVTGSCRVSYLSRLIGLIARTWLLGLKYMSLSWTRTQRFFSLPFLDGRKLRRLYFTRRVHLLVFGENSWERNEGKDGPLATTLQNSKKNDLCGDQGSVCAVIALSVAPRRERIQGTKKPRCLLHTNPAMLSKEEMV